MSPNLDKLSLELVNKEVITFMGNFFGRKDLGVEYQKEFADRLKIGKVDNSNSLLYKNFNWTEAINGKKTGGKKLDKSIGTLSLSHNLDNYISNCIVLINSDRVRARSE